MSFVFEGIQNDKDNNKFVFEGIQEKKPKRKLSEYEGGLYQGIRDIFRKEGEPRLSEERPIEPLLKREKGQALRRIPAAVSSLAEDISTFTDPAKLTLKLLGKEQPKTSEMIRPSEEGYPQEQIEAGRQLESLIQMLIPLPKFGKAEMALEKYAAKIKPVKAIKPKPPPKPSKPFLQEKGIIEAFKEDILGRKPNKEELKIFKSLYPEYEKVIETQKAAEEAQKVLEIAAEQKRLKLPVEQQPERLPIEVRPLTPAAKKLETKRFGIEEEPLKSAISKVPEESKFNIGIDTANKIKTSAEKERVPFTKIYKKVEEEYGNAYGPSIKLAAKNDELIEKLDKIPIRNAGEERVYKYAIDIRYIIGTKENPISKVSAGQLVKQSNSISEVVNYDMPYIGSKGLLRSMAHDLNKGAIDIIKSNKGNFKLLQHADRLYGKWADKYLSDEISPFLSRKIATPENLYAEIVTKAGTYRNVEKIIKNKHPLLMQKYNREVVNNKLGKYLKNPNNIGSKSYNQDLRDLSAIIGSKDTTKADRFLKNFKKQSEIRERIPKIETKGIESAKLRAFKEKQIVKIKQEELIKKDVENKIIQISKRKGFPYDKPSDIDKALNTVDEISELRKNLKSIGQEGLFDKIIEQKMHDLLRKDHVIGEKLTGFNLENILTTRKNYEIFSELFGEETVINMIEEAHAIGKTNLTRDNIIKFGKKVGFTVLGASMGAKFLKSIISVFL